MINNPPSNYMFVYNFCTFYTNYLKVDNTLTEECSYYKNNSSIEHVFYEQKLCEEWAARHLWDNAEIVFTQRNSYFNGDILSNNGNWFVYQTTYDQITDMNIQMHAYFIFMLFEFYKEHKELKEESITVEELFEHFDGSGIAKEFIIEEFDKYNIPLDNTIITENLLSMINIKNKIELNIKKNHWRTSAHET